MENTIKNKARFFALYWGQKFKYRNEYGIFEDTIGNINFERQLDEASYIPLKLISSITDEDLIKCYHLNSEATAYDYTQDFRTPLEMAKYCVEKEGDRFYKFATIHDYLRFKGYALPFMGLSVKTMIEYGWIKLKSK